MRYAIPDDWQGDWACFSIEFPDSQQWRSLLAGDISNYARGWAWDESTGDFTQAKAIGVEIREKNLPLQRCEERTLEYINWLLACLGLEQVDELPENCEEVTQIFASEDCNCEEEEEGDCMANVSNLKCENGILYMERCCQWVEVCNLSDLLGQTLPPDAQTEFTQCTLAGGYALSIYSAIANLENYMYSVNVNTAQVITDMTRQAYAALFLDSWLLFQASEIYKANLSTIHAEIPEELTVDEIRCIVYNLMSDADEFSPSPSNLSVANQFYLQIATLQQATKNYLAKLIGAINLSYLGSVIGNYRDQMFDCTCGGLPPLSPISGEHTADLWYLSAGLEGSFESSDPDEEIWPECQWCKSASEVNADPAWEWYGVAFTVYQSTASEMIRYHNPTKPVSCTADYQFTATTPPALVPGGKYIICNPTMYTYLGADVSEYTLISDSGYSIVHGSGKANDDIGMLSLRNALNNTPWNAYIRDFRFVFSGLDV